MCTTSAPSSSSSPPPSTTTTTTTTTTTNGIGVEESSWPLYHHIESDEDEESSMPPVPKQSGSSSRQKGSGVVDRHARWSQECNRAFLLVCTVGLMVDPLFLYALSISEPYVCLFIDGWLAVTVTALRCMTDAVHIWNMWVQLRNAYRMKRSERVEGRRKSRMLALRYIKSLTGFFFDLFVILPVPQVALWVTAPVLIRRGSTSTVMTVILILFLFQYLPKVYHVLCVLRRMRNSSGYVFGAVCWGISLNMIAYFVASHAAGACWYLLGIQRATECLRQQCIATEGCGLKTLACVDPIYYGITKAIKNRGRLAWAKNINARSTCLDSSDNFAYGAYQWTVQLVTKTNRTEKILFPIFWGLMTLSTFATLQSTTEWLEIVFNIIILITGLLLVTMLMGNIKVFLHTAASKKQALNSKIRSLEWWMKRRKLPQGLRRRVRQYQRQQWAAIRGVDEGQMIQNLPEGLRREIKYHLCLDLVRQVPLFQHMEELVLENICDRLKSLIFPKGETVSREGDAVKKMLFIVRGHLQSSQVLRDDVKSCCMLGPGNFSGDELLTWCLRRPFIERLPTSSSTLITLETVEAFGLEASDVKYVTQHFRYTFVNEKVKRSARYYSSGWRTWATVAIQLAWRRYKHKMMLTPLSFNCPPRPASRCSSPGEDRLRHYTALLTSPKPHKDDFA